MTLGARIVALSGVVLAMTACPFSQDEPGNPFGDAKITEILVWPNGSVRDTLFWEYDSNLNKWVRGDHYDDDEAEPWGDEIVTVTALPPYQPSGTPAVQPYAEMRRVDTSVVALYTGGRNPRTGAIAVRNATLFLPGNGPFNLQMVAERAGHRSSPLSGERQLIVGGYGVSENYLNSAEIFTLATRTFAATGSMHFARAYQAQATLADGRVLVTGGLVPVGNGPATTTTATTEIYNPSTGTFTDGPPLSVARFNHSAFTLADGRVLVLGGNNLKSAEVYTPSTNTFSSVGSMAINHGLGHTAVRLPNGKILVTGGDQSQNIQPSAVAELFDPATNTFTTAGNLTTPRMQHFAVLMSNGKVLIGGGRTTGGDALATTEIYDPVANIFTRAADMPGTSYSQSAVAIIRPGN